MVWRFSKTASANATADSTINFAEGQAPSSINDSARAEMARVAQWRDDISGTITTGGTSTAYTVTSNQVFDTLAHMDGAMIAFVPHATSGAAPTLNVDGLGAKKIRFQTGVDIPDGALVQGTPYVVTYGNSATEFILQGFAGNPYNIPLGGMMPYLGPTSAPNSSFAFPFGQALSRSTYAGLYSLVGTTFGSGDGSTTFNIIDMRGRTVFGLGNMGGSSSGRITQIGGDSFGASGGSDSHTLTTAELPASAPTFTGSLLTVNSTVTDVLRNPSGTGVASGGGTAGTGSGASAVGGYTISSTGTPAGTISNLGSGTAHSILNPGVIIPYIVRII